MIFMICAFGMSAVIAGVMVCNREFPKLDAEKSSIGRCVKTVIIFLCWFVVIACVIAAMQTIATFNL